MVKSVGPNVLVRIMYKESLGTVRGWFSGVWSGQSYIALTEDEENRSAELPLDGNEAMPSSPRTRSYDTSRNSKNAAQRMLWFILPSFLARAFGHIDEDGAIPTANATSYLNGLRGIASFIVTIGHNTDDVSNLLLLKYTRQLTNFLYSSCSSTAAGAKRPRITT